MTPTSLCVVIPAFNEAENTPTVVHDTVDALERSTVVHEWQIIVVDDGSTDEYGEIVDRLAREETRVSALHHEANRGLGAALLTGYRAARADYVTLISGDGDIGVDQPLALLADMGSADLMVSRRFRPAEMSRTVLTFGFHLLTRLITGFDPSEVDGIYVIKRSVLDSLRFRSSTGVLNYEVLMQCAARGCETRSGVMHVRPRLSGHSKVTNLPTIAKTLWELIKLRLGSR